MTTAPWLDTKTCPSQRPRMEDMANQTRAIHDGIDENIRRTGVPYLHPTSATVQRDMFCSADVAEWQEGKAAFLFMGEGCWSELPHLYARIEMRQFGPASFAHEKKCGFAFLPLCDVG